MWARCTFAASVGVLVAFCCANAYSWSARGHNQIAVQAFAQLPALQQQALAELLAQGPWVDKSNMPPPALVARAAVWPDRIRDISVKRLFQRYGSGQVPKPLRPYTERDTSAWHYVNSRFLSPADEVLAAGKTDGACSPKAQGELHHVWPKLLHAYGEAGDGSDRAIVLAFILHLGADGYQPLHVFAALDRRCEHDRGGNRFCVERRGTRCHTNLHQLWDRGFGVFTSDWYQPVAFTGEITRLQRGAELTVAFAGEIYPADSAGAQAAGYRRQAAKRVRQQARESVAHLHQVLQLLLSESVPSQQNRGTP